MEARLSVNEDSLAWTHNKKTFIHDFQKKTLNDIMLLSINDSSVNELDTFPHIMSWMSNSNGTVKRHKEHKANQSKRKNEKKESIHKKKKEKK